MSAEATGWVWKHSPWKGHHHKFVLHLAVADVVNDAHDNQFWMSQRNLADKAGVCIRSVNDWLSEAVDESLMTLIEDNGRAGKPNVYRLNLEMDHAGGKHSVPTGSAQDADRGRHSVPTKLKEEELKKSSSSIVVVDDSDSLTDSAREVLNAWVEATGRDSNRVKLNSKRIAAVKARLREGYTVSDLVAAVRGISMSSWHSGDNPERKRYDDMLVAIRDGERVERFRDLYESGGDSPAMSATDQALAAITTVTQRKELG